MALALLKLVVPTSSLYTSTRIPSQSCASSQSAASIDHGRALRTVRCISLNQTCDQTIVRRTANYKPPIWDYDSLQSLNSKYVGDIYVKGAEKLKEEVKRMLAEVVDPLGGLEMIDDLQRLGVFYHFEDEIKRVLDNIRNDDKWNNEDLHSTALQFRLLRQHYNIPQEVFNTFRDKFGNFKKSLCEDTKGLLSLYEASYLLMEDESILEEARDFTAKHLKEWLKKESIDPNLGMLVSHALELPLHWATPRMEARWFIDAYERRLDMNAKFLEFAKLDFNILQAIHQEDLKHASRWWESTGWGEKLPFVRDRVVENYLWSLGEAFEPKFQNFRSMETRINILATCVDDVYDAYGTLDELQLFTNAIDRWDVNAAEQFPDYMKICFLGLFNTINEMAYVTLKEHGVHILPYLKNKWRDLCQCYMKEARWSHSGYMPTLEEYLDHAWTSSSIPTLLTHAYFLSTNAITNEELECIEKCDDIIKWSSMVARLADDLGTSWEEVKRGDIPKSIQIYMHETGVSAEDAKEHINYLISEAWKKINEARVVDSSINGTFVEIVTNMARVSQFMYQHGDGHGHDIGGKNKERVTLLLIEPIPLK
ncbi:hypothetical protein LOK49_LG12G02338 [Camellia lanceoleosa]|uniref:Uncharacterized protein n=1 Tax=Camellia lanceoleosa TaxID=1840588 RepID=A0ACC0FX99_9ERIC|nr:hypothetical protein LOK49_LG12G02338 [Camellia lanceoleosa]